MKILTHENKSCDMDSVPEQVEDIRYCVLDCSDKKEIDFYFHPLIFMESFYAPAVVLEIGHHTIRMPLDWSIIVCDENYSDLEIIPLTSLNDRGFSSIVFNPLKHFVPEIHEIIISNVYSDVKWYFPKPKQGCILAIPLEEGDEPLCALFVKETQKIDTPIDIAELF